MNDLEKAITTFSLIVAAIFYVFTIVVFLVARKSRVNYALASQKTAWLGLVLFVALPIYIEAMPALGPPWRMWLWLLLAVLSIWVMVEVYRANWKGGGKRFFRTIYCRVTGLCRRDERPFV